MGCYGIFRGATGPTGPAGADGATGPTGPTGPIGESALPWVHAYGLPNFGGQTDFWMQAFTWVGATLNNAYPIQTNSVVFFPASGGVLTYLAVSYASSSVPAQIVTYTVQVNGVDTALTVPMSTAGFASGESFGAVVLAPSATNYYIEVHCTAPANPGSGATFPSRATVGGYVTAP